MLQAEMDFIRRLKRQPVTYIAKYGNPVKLIYLHLIN